jgi:hypothetical protein
MTNLVCFSDTHCGHIGGLTPPMYQSEFQPSLVAQVYDWFITEWKKFDKVDVLVINGDAIDGRGKKGSHDHLTTNLAGQREIFCRLINELYPYPKKILMTYGTDFHVTDGENHEDSIASEISARVSTEIALQVEEMLFHFKHTTGKTSIPHGQGTLLNKRSLWTNIKYASDIKIRSHTHEYFLSDNNLGLSVNTPALQVPCGSYGRRFDGWYDLGFVSFQVDGKEYSFNKHLCEFHNKKEILDYAKL